MTTTFKIKRFKFLFESQKLLSRLDKKERRVLSLTGVTGRREVRKRVRPRPKSRTRRKNRTRFVYSHVGPNQGLREVYFVYEPNKGTVVIGPRKYSNSGNTQQVDTGSSRITYRRNTTLPDLMNEGGTVSKQTTYKSGGSVIKNIRYVARPFVTDAVPATQKRFRELMAKVEL